MTAPDPSFPLDLDHRAGWPEDLRFLVDRYPRSVWPNHANLGAMARFWLDIHDGFRRLAATLATGTADFREGRMEVAAYRTWFRPRFGQLLSHLDAHHRIEDYQFFPLFSAVEPRLLRGFEVLEADHEAIHRSMEGAVEAARALIGSEAADRDDLLRSADGYIDAAAALQRQLLRHLDDEEDLIVPLILDRGEGPLGIG